ncbi:MAG: hypothetical protein HUU35_20020, partial [Armatimonadetes bacterium]|nr:hypothetical protein [Armatimonadota bacterium]
MRTNGWLAFWIACALGPLAAQSPLEEAVVDGEGRTVARVEWVTRTVRAVGKARLTP